MSTPAIIDFRMPPHGAPGAPSFDPDKPQTIRDFFEDLNFLLEEGKLSSGTDDEACIAHAIRYAPSEEKQVWRDLPSAKATLPDYEAFQTAVKAEYLGSNGRRLYSISDLHEIVRVSAGGRLTSASALSAYSRKFRNIGNYLVKNDTLREDERDRLFLSGLPSSLREKVLRRLEMKCPDVEYPRKPYAIDDITDAATHVLDAQSNQTPSITAQQQASTKSASGETSDTKQLTEAINKLIQLQLAQTPPSSRQNLPHFPAARLPDGCIYCSDGSHGIRYCPAVDEDIAAGLISRNDQSQVVLRSGRYVPNATAGANLRERVREYYKAHPEANNHDTPATSPTTQLFFNVVDCPPVFSRGDVPGTVVATELFAQTARPSGDEHRAKAAAERSERAQRRQVQFEEPEEIARVPANHSRIEEIPEEPETNSSRPSPTVVPATRVDDKLPSPATPPEHPFASARDVTYAPPQKRNFAAPPSKAPAVKKPDTAYRAMAPIYDPKHAANVFRRCLQSPVSLSQEELFALAPEIRQAIREAVTSRRLPIEPTLLQHGSEMPFSDDDSMPLDHEDKLSEKRANNFLSDMPTTYQQTSTSSSSQQARGTTTIQPSIPPPGSLVIQDPAEQLLKSLALGETMPPIRTALTSAAIRSVKGLFPGNLSVPCTMDTGSAIISMSEDFCHHSGLAYDPDFRLKMENANGTNNFSLGLARNVLVNFGDITVYLQMHVLQSPAYDVLLGRPFDVLLESIVQTRRDGSATITIHDPNTGKKSVLPTTPREEPQFRHSKDMEQHSSADFCDLMI